MSIKGVIRWGSIFIIMFIYICALALIIMDYGVTLKYADIDQYEKITAIRCNAIVEQVSITFVEITYVAFFGYLISIALILLIFKKVR
ncbi:hypothetical protein BN1044_04380 [Hafnia alvei]|uniref:Uncharacterized protein n=1 Tax=Hafnia alvei TaxID=569 RepID=A0A1C6Z7I5_HAFAL|nr:hypothetical protein BN1044_04380 [Hafnia alvei]